VAPPAREAVAHAVKANPRLAEAQTSLGFVKFWLDWEWPAAEDAFRRAIDLDPNYPLAHRLLGIVLAHMQRYEEAEHSIGRARELDPLVAGHHALSSQVAFMGRKYDAALQFARQAITIDPEFWIGHMQLGQSYEQLGEFQLALDALNDAVRLSGGNSKALGLRGYIFARNGRTEEAQAVIEILKSVSRERYVPPYAMALIQLGLGRHDAVFDWLERAFEMRDVHLAFLPNDVKWDTLRADSRFISLIERGRFLHR
jgi:tetratricopeptide (TPR) repeat protein